MSDTLKPNKPPNSSNHLLFNTLSLAAEAGPPYSFCEFSPQMTKGTLSAQLLLQVSGTLPRVLAKKCP